MGSKDETGTDKLVGESMDISKTCPTIPFELVTFCNQQEMSMNDGELVEEDGISLFVFF